MELDSLVNVTGWCLVGLSFIGLIKGSITLEPEHRNNNEVINRDVPNNYNDAIEVNVCDYQI